MPRDLSLDQLERTLFEIGGRLEDPPAADLADAVARRLRSDPARGGPVLRMPRWRRPSLSWRPAVAAVAAVAVLIAGILTVSPGARHAVAGWLGLRGVQIEVTPSPLPTSLPSGPRAIELGPLTSLADAQRQVGFRILLPHTAELGSPDEVHVQPLYLSEQVFLVYRPRAGLPAAPETGLAVLVSEFRAAPDEGFYKKLSVGSGTVEFVRVKGQPGYWIQGGHEVAYVDDNGIPIQDTARLAANVLLWQRGDLTLRIESSLSRSEVLRIARSFA
ncbi:MAG TPA: hypothetical protein VKA30_00885 [Actinomycetota bacterium]|nr:hypothetical protein [Actinomycetota bacterium]